VVVRASAESRRAVSTELVLLLARSFAATDRPCASKAGERVARPHPPQHRNLTPTTPHPTTQVLSGFAATAAALLAAESAQANTPIDLFDDRKARKNGFDIIYEARELDLPQNVREGFTQARGDIKATITRVKESEKRLDSTVEPSVQKAYWCVLASLVCAAAALVCFWRWCAGAGRAEGVRSRCSTSHTGRPP